MADVFISYSNKDSHLANQVCSALEAAGLRCWIAPRDISKGTLWPEAITTALEQCPVVVLIFTANSNASPDVLNEIALATENNAARIVFQAEAVPPSKSLKYYLHVVQWLDATAPPLKPHLRELVEAVRLALAAQPVPEPAVVRIPGPAAGTQAQPAKTTAAAPQPGVDLKPQTPRVAKNPRVWLTRVGMLALGGIILAGVLLAQGGGASPPVEQLTETPRSTAPPLLTAAAAFPTATAILPTKPAPPPCTAVNLERGWLSPVDGMGMLCVPAGEFLMGLPAGHPLSRESDTPQLKVFVSAFWVDKTEVTNDMYHKFLNETKIQPTGNEGAGPPWLGFQDSHQRISWDLDRWWVQKGFENHPVALVSWYGAKAYCEWAGRRLLTEAEWEKAARGVDGRLYTWGNEPPTCELTNFSIDKKTGCAPETGTTPVDTHRTGAPFGGADFTGNVWEWVADWFLTDWYREVGEGVRDPIGPQEGDSKVFRGGSFMNTSSEIITTFRDREKPTFTDWSVGFRCGY